MPANMFMQDRNDSKATMKALFPAVDASMITQMKRRQAIVLDAISHPAGRKQMGVVVDTQKTRGRESGVVPIYVLRGAGLSFFR